VYVVPPARWTCSIIIIDEENNFENKSTLRNNYKKCIKTIIVQFVCAEFMCQRYVVYLSGG